MSIFPIVVLYNIDLEGSIVYKELLVNCSSYLVYDNSVSPINKKYANERIHYHHDSDNGGVSAAYNYGAKVAKELGGVEAILLLDQDTKFQPGLIETMERELSKYPDVDLFVPQVTYGNNMPFSPILRGLFGKNHILPEGKYSLNQYLPVNAGACIRLNAFDKVGGYNPNIRLDFADFDFFSRLCEINPHFRVVNISAYQSFSNDEKNPERLFRRYCMFLEGAKFARKNPLISRRVVYDVIKHTIALTLRTKSLKFLKYLINK